MDLLFLGYDGCLVSVGVRMATIFLFGASESSQVFSIFLLIGFWGISLSAPNWVLGHLELDFGALHKVPLIGFWDTSLSVPNLVLGHFSKCP